MRQMRFVAIFFSALFILTGCTYLFPPEEELLAPPLIEPEEVTYRTTEVQLGEIIDKKEVRASFSPSMTASMAFEGPGGRVSEIAVKLNQAVKKGDLLIELNSETLRRQIRQQQIEVEKAQLALESAGQVVQDDPYFDMTRFDRLKLEVQVAEDEYAYMEGHIVEERKRGANVGDVEKMERALYEQGIVVEKARLSLKSLEEEYERWLLAQQSTPGEEVARQTRIQQAELELKKQQNALADLQGDLKNAQLFAPFDGVVTYVMPNMEVGQNVEGYVTLFRISDPTQIVLTYSGDQAHIFTVGMEVTIKIDGKDYPGSVAADPHTIPTTDGKMVTDVTFVIDGLQEAVKMGDSAMITAILRHHTDAVVLPKNCVNTFWGRKFVNLLEDGVKVERDIETGIETSTEIEVVKGLEPGELVIMP